MITILFGGGGTGGHLYPAIAIADAMKQMRPDTNTVFVGTKEKIEARVVPERGYTFVTIWISGFRRTLSFSTLLFPVKVVVAVLQSFILIKRIRPNVVVGTGGYVCGPPLFVASILGIPTLIQEQNSYPGVTTRLLASRVNEVHLTFERSRRYLKRQDNVRLTGNPTREAIGNVSRKDAAKALGLDQGKKTVLVFGGSLGASSINTVILKILPAIAGLGLQVIWQTGTKDYAQIRKTVPGDIHLYEFIDRMEHAYAVCDLAVCRAGATTLSELTKAGVPSILVPYPFATADHQTENAKAMVEGGASVMCADSRMESQLLTMIKELADDPERLHSMSAHARSMSRPDAARELAGAVFHLAGV